MPAWPLQLTVTMDPDLPALDRHGEPVSIGVPLPKGCAPRGTEWCLTDADARPVRVQATPLDRWGDGSVRWMLVEFTADVQAGESADYFLSVADSAAMSPAASLLRLRETSDAILVDTGVAQFDVRASGGAFLARAEAQGVVAIDGSSVEAEDIDGRPSSLAIDRATVERAGPQTAVVRVDGALQNARGEAWLDVVARLYFFTGLGAARVELSVTNPRAARHPGGLWDLGDPGSALIRHLSIRLNRAGASADGVTASIDRSCAFEASGSEFSIYQASSGGAQWQHLNHVNRRGVVPLAFRGYRVTANSVEGAGDRATPIVSMGAGLASVSVAMPHFWEAFPKAISADGRHCAIAMLPRNHPDGHELQGGERTTMTFAICVGPDTVTNGPLLWTRSPLRVAIDPAVCEAAQVCAPLTVGSAAARERYRQLVDVAIAGGDSFRGRRETIDEYGWRHFGELYADHESVGHSEPRVSHYNNQYDAVAGFAVRFLATADHRWFVAMDELASHVTDIDLYHTAGDRAAYNGGYFWHTQHYAPAATATHRAYSRSAGAHGGGPSAEHNYTTGLMLHYFLTGSERSRAAVVQLANWVLDMDDGRKSRFRWIDRDDTGLASGTRSPDYHGPGRGAGNSINALLDAHRLTADQRYLDKADRLIARCVHPDDDPAAIDPLDAENRWSYTVFLQALGKYLEHLAERGIVDRRYAYAREVLLRYARWMVLNECPYLDHPERLEYPTETWPAQDLRKAAVLEYAARLTDVPAERSSFIVRAGEFFDAAIATLASMPTSRLVRPIVLLLAYGLQRPLVAQALVATARPVAGERLRFVPLRRRVINKLAWAGAGVSAALIIAMVLFIS